MLRVTPARLSQACKELLGLTPISVVHEQKLMQAKRKLTYSRISDAEIAYQLGFKDPAYFSRFFRRYTRKRSAEHTSELQSLMRISYAAFCLYTNKPTQTHKKPN